MAFDIIFTFQILIIVIVAFWAITAWDAALDRSLINAFHLDENSVITHVIIGVIATIIFILLLLIFDIEAHDILGIAETVDAQLTGHPEEIVNGKIVYY